MNVLRFPQISPESQLFVSDLHNQQLKHAVIVENVIVEITFSHSDVCVLSTLVYDHYNPAVQ